MAKTQKKTKTPVKPKKAVRVVARDRAPRTAAAVQETRGKLERVKMPTPSGKGMRVNGGAADESNEGKYVYCIIKTEEALIFGPLGIGSDPAEVHTVNYRDIAAVVSNTPMVVQD